jgi:hypothetical protein
MPKAETRIGLIVSLLLIALSYCNPALGWHDETHIAVAKAAGYEKWYNATGADIAKIKAKNIELNNHFFSNPDNLEITPRMVLEQTERYNDPDDAGGHLYGAIIASLREYKSTTLTGKYAEYHLAFCAHYVADLSQPFHNIPYDSFNKARHDRNDGIVDAGVLENLHRLEENMYPISLNPDDFEKDLAKEIARIANISRRLGNELKRQDRDMTAEEAYRQLGHSASLLRAILDCLGK